MDAAVNPSRGKTLIRVKLIIFTLPLQDPLLDFHSLHLSGDIGTHEVCARSEISSIG